MEISITSQYEKLAHIMRLLLETRLDEISEITRPSFALIESRCFRLGYQEENPHRMIFGERRFSFCHLDRRDPK